MNPTTPTMTAPFEESAAPDIVQLEAVTKRFRVRKDNSLKDRIVHLGKLGKAHRQDFYAVDSISFSIEAGTTVGLMGANGSGKSTLLKLIGGIVTPTSGTIRHRGRMAALLELGAGFHPDLSGRENVYLNAAILGLSHAEVDERFDDIVAFSGIGDFIDTAVKFYSSGCTSAWRSQSRCTRIPTSSWSMKFSRSAMKPSSASAWIASISFETKAAPSSS